MRYVGGWGVKSSSGLQRRDHHLGVKLLLISQSLKTCKLSHCIEHIRIQTHTHILPRTQLSTHTHTRSVLVTRHVITSVPRAHMRAACCWSRSGPRTAVHPTAVFHHHLHGNHALSHRDNEFHLGLWHLLPSPSPTLNHVTLAARPQPRTAPYNSISYVHPQDWPPCVCPLLNQWHTLYKLISPPCSRTPPMFSITGVHSQADLAKAHLAKTSRGPDVLPTQSV